MPDGPLQPPHAWAGCAIPHPGPGLHWPFPEAQVGGWGTGSRRWPGPWEHQGRVLPRASGGGPACLTLTPASEPHLEVARILTHRCEIGFAV